MGINTDKNSYTLLFAIGMTIVVGTLLAAIDSSLRERIDTNKIDILAVQETSCGNEEKVQLSNMKMVDDDNKSENKGAALYVNKRFTITKLKEFNKRCVYRYVILT